MAEKRINPPKMTIAKTKQEMLEAYNELRQELEEKRAAELKPEAKIEEKKVKEAVEIADAFTTDGIVKETSSLRGNIGKFLSELADSLEEEVNKYRQVRKAIEAKEKEVQEIYEIEKSALSLSALIEAQQQKRQEFEQEMAAKKEALEREIQNTRTEWEKEKRLHEIELKERDGTELKKKEREREEYLYTFSREQQLANDQFQDQKVKFEKEILEKKEKSEKELAEREKVILQKEEELNDLRKKVASFPKELDAAINKVVKEAREEAQLEAKTKEDLMKKEFEGERNVLNTRITLLEKTLKEQNEQIAKLSQHLEKAYGQVQDIAVKSVEGSLNIKSLGTLQQLVAEQTRKQSQEK